MKILSSGGHNGTLYIVPESFGGNVYDENPIIQTGKGHMATGSSARFHHIKTNIAGSSNIMYHIQAEGYNYGTSQPIDCVWTGYTWSGWSGQVHNASQKTFYPGMTAHSMYMSSDGYVVLVGDHIDAYYTGYIINAMFPCPSGRWHTFEVLSIQISATEATGVF